MYLSESENQKVFKSLSIENSGQPVDQFDLARRLDQEAGLKAGEGKTTEAEELYKQAIAAYEQTTGSGQSEFALCLNHLAELFFGHGKFIQAEAAAKRALAVREKILGPDHPEVAESLFLYAKILRQKKFNYKAAQLEARAKSIRRSNKINTQ